MRRLLFSREIVLLLLLLGLFVAFAITVDGFADASNIFRRSRYWVATGMIAVPMTFIIATAGIDLSVGSIVALSSIVLGLLYTDAGWPIVPAAMAAILAGLAAGAFNGGVSSYVKVPPLVVTLATMALFRGVAMGLSEARSLGNLPREFLWLSTGNLLGFLGPGTAPYAPISGFPLGWVMCALQWFKALYIPVSLVPLAMLFLIGWFLMRRSWVGRFTECIGENEIAAQFAAINVRFMKFALYSACGLVCGLASLFHTALYSTAKADTARGMELEVIACVVIGGTRISGGSGTVLGALLGLLIIGILRYGLEMAGVRSQYVVICVGLLLIATAVFNEGIARRQGDRT